MAFYLFFHYILIENLLILPLLYHGLISNLLLFRSAEYDIEPGFSNYHAIDLIKQSPGFVSLIFIKKGIKSIKILGFLFGATLVIFSGTRFKLIYLVLPSLITILFSLR